MSTHRSKKIYGVKATLQTKSIKINVKSVYLSGNFRKKKIVKCILNTLCNLQYITWQHIWQGCGCGYNQYFTNPVLELKIMFAITTFFSKKIKNQFPRYESEFFMPVCKNVVFLKKIFQCRLNFYSYNYLDLGLSRINKIMEVMKPGETVIIMLYFLSISNTLPDIVFKVNFLTLDTGQLHPLPEPVKHTQSILYSGQAAWNI